MKMHSRAKNCIRVRICSIFPGGANSVEQISIRMHICLRVQIAHMNATCYHIIMYNLIFDFDKPIFPIRTCMEINYINRPFIKLKVMASLCSHYFMGYAGLPSRTTGT